MPRDLIANPEIVAPAALDADGEILERAADFIEVRGLCQKAAQDHVGRLCTLGSIWHALGREFIRLPEYDQGFLVMSNPDLVRLAERLDFRDTEEVGEWTDAPGRTAAEVVARLRAAARGEL